MFSLLSRRILQTVAYTDQFSYPLKLNEIWLRLLFRASFKECQAEVHSLQNQGYLVEKDGYYFIPRLVGESGVETRVLRQKTANSYQTLINEVVTLLKKIPWITAVAVTGSLSMNVAKPGDDLDFMIITQPNRLWLTRALVVFISTIKKRRRYWWEDQAWLASTVVTMTQTQAESAQKPKWCFNLWLTTEALVVPPAGRSIYTAHEVLQANFVFSRGYVGQQSIEQAFLAANSWVRRVLPQFWQFRQHQSARRATTPHSTTSVLSILLHLLDAGCYYLQMWYMKSHMTREKVSRNMAYFHPRPTKKLVHNGWQVALERALLVATRVKRNRVSKVMVIKKSSTSSPTAAPVFDPNVIAAVQKIQTKRQTIVLVTGVFDLLHYAHRQFLLKARSKGDALVVGLESDVRVKHLKGEGRPIHNQLERQKQLENLGIADLVFILPEQFSQPSDHQALLQLVKPKVLAVSSHTPHLEAKQKAMAQVGGNVVVVMEHDPSVSTTILLQQMK